MTKTELVDTLYSRFSSNGLTKKALREIVDQVLDTIGDTLAKGEKVELHGFGNFVVRNRAERVTRNIRTREPIKVPAKKVVTFRPASRLKDAVK